MEELSKASKCIDDAAGKKLISVDFPYSFDLISKALRKDGKIVKNCWVGPDQKEVDLAIDSIEAAAEVLKVKNN